MGDSAEDPGRECLPLQFSRSLCEGWFKQNKVNCMEKCRQEMTEEEPKVCSLLSLFRAHRRISSASHPYLSLSPISLFLLLSLSYAYTDSQLKV